SSEEERQHGLSHGSFSYVVKPATTEHLERAFDRIKTYVTPHTKRLLVVEDNDIERQSIVELLAHDEVAIRAADVGARALYFLARENFDCCVVDLRLPDMTGFELLEEIHADESRRDLPVVIFT